MSKSADAFRTISEVAEWLGVQTHVLRFWESKFTQVKPVKRAGGRRYYRPGDMLLLGGIRKLLHDDGLTIKGVQKVLREEGMAHVADMSRPLDEESHDRLESDLLTRMDDDLEVRPTPTAGEVVPLTPARTSSDPAIEAPMSVLHETQPAPTATDRTDDAPRTDAPAVPAFMRPAAPGPAQGTPPALTADFTPQPAPETKATPAQVSSPSAAGTPGQAIQAQATPQPPVASVPLPSFLTARQDLEATPTDTATHTEQDTPSEPIPHQKTAPDVDTAAPPSATERVSVEDAPADDHAAAPVADPTPVEPAASPETAPPQAAQPGAPAVEPQAPVDASPPADDATHDAIGTGISEPENDDAPDHPPAPPAAAEPILRARVIDAPDAPDTDALPATPGPLSRLARAPRLTAPQRAALSPVLAQLTALRDQMAAAARDGR